ncbi:hypothetical protein A4G19_07800 [Pasteurellaceae bacterium Macca]|nr:hypothetical protein [Pasteurellaceae bacterium Macca]
MKKITVLVMAMILMACSESYFQPPKPYDSWRLDPIERKKDIEEAKKKGVSLGVSYVIRREDDMRACGMDFVSGESVNPEVNLCMESKGWYLEGGPVCENMLMWNDSVCIKWRKKHSAPDVKPWDCKDNPTYPTCLQTGSKR